MSKLYLHKYIFIMILVFVKHSDDVTDWGQLSHPVSAGPVTRVQDPDNDKSLDQDGGRPGNVK